MVISILIKFSMDVHNHSYSEDAVGMLVRLSLILYVLYYRVWSIGMH